MRSDTRPAVRVRGVGKRYRHTALRTRRITDLVLARFRAPRGRSFWALRDVSFEVDPGRTVGIIGPNGAGKSTLLRLLAGVGRPDAGEISVDGRVAGIFELGTGFHPELTGRESALLTGVILGLSRRQIRQRLPEIAAFAELEEFLEDPVRTYSSGMVARLAFAIAIHVDADVLLVDEALAVGDLAFQQRCFDRLKYLQRTGVTMVVVSHAPAALRELCDEVLWLQGGRIEARGRPEEVSARYASTMRERARAVTPPQLETVTTTDGLELKLHENRIGTQQARVTSLRLLDRWATSLVGAEVTSGDLVQVCFDIDAPAALGDVNVAVHIVREDDGVLCIDTSTILRPSPDGRAHRSVRLECSRLDLAAGRYACEVGLYSADWTVPYDHHAGVYRFAVRGSTGGRGVLAPPLVWHREPIDHRPSG